MTYMISRLTCRVILLGVTETLVDNNFWGRVTQTCISKLIMIGPDNGLSPDWRQAILWTNGIILLIGPMGINTSENLIATNTLSFRKNLGLNVLNLTVSSGTVITYFNISYCIEHRNDRRTWIRLWTYKRHPTPHVMACGVSIVRIWETIHHESYVCNHTLDSTVVVSSMEGLMVVMMASSNRNIFRVTVPLCGEFISHRWIPRTKASDAELWCFLWSVPE